MNRSFTKSNSSLRIRKANTELLNAKNKNIQLAKSHENLKLQLNDLVTKEDDYINLNIVTIDKKINEITKDDLIFYRKESSRILIQLLDTTQFIEKQMYNKLDELHKLILQNNNSRENGSENNLEENGLNSVDNLEENKSNSVDSMKENRSNPVDFLKENGLDDYLEENDFKLEDDNLKGK